MMDFDKIQYSVFIIVVIVIPVGQCDLVFMRSSFFDSKESLKIVRINFTDVFGFFAIKAQHIVCNRIGLCEL